MKCHVAGQPGSGITKKDLDALKGSILYDLWAMERRLLIKFGCLLLVASLIGLLVGRFDKILIEEPFYLFIGIIAAFTSGLVLFFTSRPE